MKLGLHKKLASPAQQQPSLRRQARRNHRKCVHVGFSHQGGVARMGMAASIYMKELKLKLVGEINLKFLNKKFLTLVEHESQIAPSNSRKYTRSYHANSCLWFLKNFMRVLNFMIRRNRNQIFSARCKSSTMLVCRIPVVSF